MLTTITNADTGEPVTCFKRMEIIEDVEAGIFEARLTVDALDLELDIDTEFVVEEQSDAEPGS